ncbi:MAG: hypothetical protein KF823_04785 [Xanthomonadales bacterium]|nr:hypothetical protein [Xanthomonadales bacterium]
MRTLIARLALAPAVLLLVACAGNPVQTGQASLRPSQYEIDHARIAQVERSARMNWGRVYWLSLPTRKVEPAPPGDLPP